MVRDARDAWLRGSGDDYVQLAHATDSPGRPRAGRRRSRLVGSPKQSARGAPPRAGTQSAGLAAMGVWHPRGGAQALAPAGAVERGGREPDIGEGGLI